MHTRRFLAFVAACVLLGGVATNAFFQRPSSAPGMTAAAKEFLASLDDTQRAAAAMKFDDPYRLAWHFIPKPFEGPQGRKGVTLKSMNEKSRAAAMKLVAAGLSESGYKTATQIMAIEQLLAKLEGPMPERKFQRDPQMYFFTVYGTPGSDRWGYRCEGHHLSLNFVIEGEKLVSATPTFFGANPGEVPEGDQKGLRILERREDVARTLLKSLDEEQKKAAVQSDKAPDDLRGGGGPALPTGEQVMAPHPDPSPAVGLAAGKMTAEQKKVLKMLLEEYSLSMAADIATEWTTDLEKAGFDNIQFAWWGGENRHERHYYRVQGPTFIIEYNNTQSNANHVHSMWRNTKGDFGVPVAKN